MMHSPPFRSPRDDAIRRRVQPLSEAAAAVPHSHHSPDGYDDTCMDLSAISGSLCVVDCSELFEIIGEVHEPSAGKATPPPSTRLCPPSSFETIGRPREGYALWPPGTSLGRPTEKKRPQPHLDPSDLGQKVPASPALLMGWLTDDPVVCLSGASTHAVPSLLLVA